MTRYLTTSLLLFVTATASLSIVGCGPRIENYDMPQKTSVTRARELFQGYVNGNRPTSEMDSYPNLIEQVRTEDAKAAEVIVPALEKIKANPAGAKATAEKALKDLDAAAPAATP